MSKQYKNGKCSCWKAVEKKLATYGTGLTTSFTFDGYTYLNIQTCKLDMSPGLPKSIFASYCPFCGGKLKRPETKENV